MKPTSAILLTTGLSRIDGPPCETYFSNFTRLHCLKRQICLLPSFASFLCQSKPVKWQPCQQITSKTNTQHKTFFLVKCILFWSENRWREKKNNLTFIEGLESLVYRAWFSLFSFQKRTIKLQTIVKGTHHTQKWPAVMFISSNRPVF